MHTITALRVDLERGAGDKQLLMTQLQLKDEERAAAESRFQQQLHDREQNHVNTIATLEQQLGLARAELERLRAELSAAHVRLESVARDQAALEARHVQELRDQVCQSHDSRIAF